MNKLWFKAKTFGWGWTPATWQGWTAMVVYVVLIAGSAIGILRPGFKPIALVWWFAVVLAATGGLFALSYATGETPRWRWGGEGDDRRE